LLKARGYVSGMTCSACVGLEAPLLADEVRISTSTRNFRGRMGSADSRIYLGSPATVAASAIAGKISDPREYF